MAEVALWQYRWLNPGNYPDQPLSMLEWKNVEAWNPRMQTVEQRVEELRSFRYDGKPAYEVRALGVIPDGVLAVDEAQQAYALRRWIAAMETGVARMTQAQRETGEQVLAEMREALRNVGVEVPRG